MTKVSWKPLYLRHREKLKASKAKHLIGYEVCWDDTCNAVLNAPIYSDTPPPVELREEYLGELAMRVWYRLNVEHEFRLPIITVRVQGAKHLSIGCSDGVYKNVGITVYKHTLTYNQLLNGIVRRIACAMRGRITQANEQVRRVGLTRNRKPREWVYPPQFCAYSQLLPWFYTAYDLRPDFEAKYEAWRRKR